MGVRTPQLPEGNLAAIAPIIPYAVLKQSEVLGYVYIRNTYKTNTVYAGNIEVIGPVYLLLPIDLSLKGRADRWVVIT